LVYLAKLTKREIFLSIVENEEWLDDWAVHCKQIQVDLLENKTIKKPTKAVNDAVFTLSIFKKIKLKFWLDH
jgi:hypothetical protein